MIAVTLAACGGSGSSTSTTSSTTGSTTKTSGSNGILNVAIAAVPESLDPQLYQSFASQQTYPTVAATLLRYVNSTSDDELSQNNAKVECFLCESYKVNPDSSYSFVLRKGVKSAAGNELTTDDVKWSIDRMVAIDPVFKLLAGGANIDLKNPITVTGKYTFKMNVTAPTVLLGSAMQFNTTGITDSVEAKKHATAKDPWAKDWLAKNLATFGPYQLTSFTPGEQLSLKANPGFWNDVSVKTVVFRATPDSASRLQLLLSGQVQKATALTAAQFKSAQDAKDKVTAVLQTTSGADWLVPNQKYKPFADARVRQALAMAINRQALVTSAYGGTASPLLHQIPDGTPVPNSRGAAIEENVDAAKKLLADAGYPNGFEFTAVASPARPGQYIIDVATQVQSQLAQIGVKMQIQPVASGPQFQEIVAGGKAQAWFDAYGPSLNSAPFFAFNWFTTQGYQDTEGYKNPDLEKVVAQALRTAPGDAYDQLNDQMMEILGKDVPFIPLVNTKGQILYTKNVGGTILNPIGQDPSATLADLLKLS